MDKLDWFARPFFDVAHDFVTIFLSRFPQFFEFTRLPIGEIIDKLPPFGFGILQYIAEILSKALNVPIEVPEFTVIGLGVDLIDNLIQNLDITDFSFSDISLYAFLLGYGAIIIAVLTIGRWLYKFFD